MSSRPRLRLTLTWKFVLAFAAVVAIGIGTVSAMANLTAAREVRGFMFRGGMTGGTQAVQELAAYYRGRGSWQGVGDLFAGGHPGMMGGMMGPGPKMADASGMLLVDPSGQGGALSPAERAAALGIVVDGRTVGYLLPQAGADAGAAERDLVARVNRAIWLAALTAGGAALLIGGLLVMGLLRPVRELTAAAQALAKGDLSRRVPVHTGDELGDLSQAFNQMAEALQRAESLRREMTADVAHELRNPLAVMQAGVEAVLDGVHSPTAESLAPVLEQTRLLNRLVDDLRTLALADAGQLGLELTETDLRGWLTRCVETYRAQAEAAGVELHLTVPDERLTANADGMRLEQVLGNLLANALRHTPPGRPIDVSLRRLQANRVALEVADRGEGLSPEALPYLFERFYRGDKGRSRESGGTGLGLAIARKLVEAHGGSIRAASRPGGGAVFTVELPTTSRFGPA